MKSEGYSMKDRLIELIGRYEELIQYGPYGNPEFISDNDQIDNILPEDITCGKDAEVVIERAWYSFAGEYELISAIANKVRAMMNGIEADPAVSDGQYSFVVDGGKISLPNVA